MQRRIRRILSGDKQMKYTEEQMDEINIKVNNALCKLDYLAGIINGQVSLLMSIDSEIHSANIAKCLMPLQNEFEGNSGIIKNALTDLQDCIYELNK